MNKHDGKYIKVRFTSKKNGSTAGLVFASQELEKFSIEKISRHFSIFESMKMERIEQSQSYGTWKEAFNHQF